ncbi:signal transduction histidine kinase LytS [Gloeocapsopsis crepidinum LEGE 06123]|uniref:Signal transduction histidine kinase LytS n=1 Tax=Gloeocapsopsis crepidinum LEGE 06123 TaxID=588587 RepID=A0ABR9UPY6_9CHRO|nr:general stress protein [Gloeocapsopsis crepidinum]MBE9190341.1 signal transduction histidine kinase LytS [Gloeocapsopsis crepidinum LEGE 06123]
MATQLKRAVGTFSSRTKAESALNTLRDSGFKMDKVSILAKDSTRDDQIAGVDLQDRNQVNERGNTEAQEGAGIGATTGTILGGAGGLLVGLEALLIPGVGPFLAGGTIATTLAGAGIGAAAGSIVGALTGLGIPEEDAKTYSDRVSHGDYLVFIEGTAADIDRASTLLSNQGVHQWNVYDMPASNSYADTIPTNAKVEPRIHQDTVEPTTHRYTSDKTKSNVVNTTNQPEVKVVDRRKETR